MVKDIFGFLLVVEVFAHAFKTYLSPGSTSANWVILLKPLVPSIFTAFNPDLTSEGRCV